MQVHIPSKTLASTSSEDPEYAMFERVCLPTLGTPALTPAAWTGRQKLGWEEGGARISDHILTSEPLSRL